MRQNSGCSRPSSEDCGVLATPAGIGTDAAYPASPSPTSSGRDEASMDVPKAEDDSASNILRWRKGDKIGAGAHGLVFKAQNLANGELFVVKESYVNVREYHDNLRRELDICRHLEHPNIVKYLGHEYCDHHLYVQLEYVSGGSLRCMLEEFGPLEQELMLVAMKGLLEGLDYLHTQSPPVVHRDIKSANVLVGQDFCMKLADFGCSKRDDTTTSFTTLGSVLWMAPEVIRGSMASGYGRKADIWSLGCVFLEMATAEMPWGSKAFDNIFQAARHIESSGEVPFMPESLPTSIRSLIECCINRESNQRLHAAELLSKECLQNVGRSQE